MEGGETKKTPVNVNAMKGIVQSVIMALIGLLVYKWLGHAIMAYVVWGLAAVVLVSGLFIPPVFNAIEKFGQLLGLWVGTGLTYALLVPFFYLIMFPGKIVLSIKGKDPMCRKFPSDEKSYWAPKKPVKDIHQYEKQF